MRTVEIVATALMQMSIAGLTQAAGSVSAPRLEIKPRPVRARDLGVPFEGTPGARNAITDVPGVEVGFTTLISG